MGSRITITKGKHGNVEIWLSEADRDHLVRALQMLSQSDDYIHLGSAEFKSTQLPLQTVAYREGDQVLSWGKILFRRDAWDAKHFLHVLDSSDPSEPR